MSDTAVSIKNTTAPYRFAGFWLAIALALMMFGNAVRTFTTPAVFAQRMGLPVNDAAGFAWVQVYGLRAFFIGLVVSYFLVMRDPRSLKWFSGLAITMTLGDAYLVSTTGGSTAATHLFIGAILAVGVYLFHRWQRAISIA